MAGFDVDSPVVLPDHVRYRGDQLWLLWPALRYRVVAPLVHEERLNVFQSAVLGLARSGYREVGEVAALLGLQGDLVEMVRSDLRALSYLDRHGAVTDTGLQALRDGFPDPTRTITTYVYQDVLTGSLWPASTLQARLAQADWRARHQVSLQLRTAGAPLRVTAFPVLPEGWTGTEQPSHEEVVEAVSRGERAKQERGRARRWDRAAPDRVVSRVALMTSGVPVWIPVPLVSDRHEPASTETVSWDAFSPFNGRSSTYLRRLVATRLQQVPALREQVERFIGRRSEAVVLEYDRLDIALRRRIGEVLEDRFAGLVRAHRDLFELLTLLERDMDRARLTGDGCTEIGDVVRNAWRLHEVVLRDIVARHPPPADAPELTPHGNRFAGPLGRCCRRLGMPFGEHLQVLGFKADEFRTAVRRPEKVSNTPALLAAVLVSGAHGGSDHPVRRLAEVRPHLFTELRRLSSDRNTGGAHAAVVPLNLDTGEAAWALAQHTTAAYLGVDLPDLSRPSRKDNQTHGEEQVPVAVPQPRGPVPAPR
ncbi:hypothetical protein PSH03_003776 [Micromonospora sp. PSH03]|uniref:hypothetical protein n=1 Tax=Micromonospora salmantinae TaxID=2911211 RepID=UPI001EE91FD5|nr:hypothetical protein [Micromonospora salmantinae]MCG5454616.1 hypothetical protein [Micromonospora salmantinae]